MKRNKKYFTLIELMVVISIIVILVSILLPALKKSRDYTYSIQCKNNQKQCGVALFSYASENNGWIKHGYNWYKNIREIGVNNWEILWCPMPAYHHQKGWIQGIYGIHYYTELFQQDGPSHANSHYRITNPKYSPSITMLIADTYGNGWTRQYPIFNSNANYNGAMCLRHPAFTANILFDDGHVESCNRPDLKQTKPKMNAVVLTIGPDKTCPKVTF